MSSKKFIASGILEAHCLGVATTRQTSEVILMAAIFDDVKAEIDIIYNALQKVKYTEAFLVGNSKIWN